MASPSPSGPSTPKKQIGKTPLPLKDRDDSPTPPHAALTPPPGFQPPYPELSTPKADIIPPANGKRGGRGGRKTAASAKGKEVAIG